MQSNAFMFHLYHLTTPSCASLQNMCFFLPTSAKRTQILFHVQTRTTLRCWCIAEVSRNPCSLPCPCIRDRSCGTLFIHQLSWPLLQLSSSWIFESAGHSDRQTCVQITLLHQTAHITPDNLRTELPFTLLVKIPSSLFVIVVNALDSRCWTTSIGYVHKYRRSWCILKENLHTGICRQTICFLSTSSIRLRSLLEVTVILTDPGIACFLPLVSRTGWCH